MDLPRATATADRAAPRVLLVDPDPATAALLAEWLAADGYVVADDDDAAGSAACALAVVAVPYPRDGGAAAICRVAAAHPGVPLLALSPTLFGNVECSGACARSLGVAGVLPMPVPREALLGAVRRLLRAPR